VRSQAENGEVAPRTASDAASDVKRISSLESRPAECHREAESAGELHPEPLKDSGLEPLDSSGSCHPLKAAAFRRNQRVPPVALDVPLRFLSLQ